MSKTPQHHEDLSAWLDGELNEADAARVAEAVEHDAGLRREADELLGTRDLLRRLPAPESDDLVGRVLAAAERQKLVTDDAHKPSSVGRWLRLVASAAVLLIAAGVGAVVVTTLWSGRPGSIVFDTGEEGIPETLARREDKPSAAADRGVERRLDRIGEEDGLADDAHVALAKGAGGSGAAATELAKAPEPTPAPAPPGLAKDGPATGGLALSGPDGDELSVALAAVPTDNEVIFTDRMGMTRRQVEKLLISNSVLPVRTRKVATAPVAKAKARGRANFYRVNRLAETQVQYEAYVTPEQMNRVQKELTSLRAQQTVSQRAPGGPQFYAMAAEAPTRSMEVALGKNANGRFAGKAAAGKAVATPRPVVEPDPSDPYGKADAGKKAGEGVEVKPAAEPAPTPDVRARATGQTMAVAAPRPMAKPAPAARAKTAAGGDVAQMNATQPTEPEAPAPDGRMRQARAEEPAAETEPEPVAEQTGAGRRSETRSFAAAQAQAPPPAAGDAAGDKKQDSRSRGMGLREAVTLGTRAGDAPATGPGGEAEDTDEESVAEAAVVQNSQNQQPVQVVIRGERGGARHDPGDVAGRSRPLAGAATRRARRAGESAGPATATAPAQQRLVQVDRVDLQRAFATATTQSAATQAARLQRLLITVNFRHPGEVTPPEPETRAKQRDE